MADKNIFGADMSNLIEDFRALDLTAHLQKRSTVILDNLCIRNILLHGWRTLALFVCEQLVFLLTASNKLNATAEPAGHRFFEFSHEFLNFTRLQSYSTKII